MPAISMAPFLILAYVLYMNLLPLGYEKTYSLIQYPTCMSDISDNVIDDISEFTLRPGVILDNKTNLMINVTCIDCEYSRIRIKGLSGWIPLRLPGFESYYQHDCGDSYVYSRSDQEPEKWCEQSSQTLYFLNFSSALMATDADQAMSFNGISDFLQLEDIDVTDGLTFDFEFMINRTPDNNQIIYSDNRQHGVYFRATSNDVRFFLRLANNTLCDPARFKTDLIKINEWHRLSGTFDGRSLALYLDNVLMDERGCMGHVMNEDNGWFVIGRDKLNRFYYQGMLRNFRIYDKALLPEVIVTSVEKSSDNVWQNTLIRIVPNVTLATRQLKIQMTKAKVIQDLEVRITR